MGFEPPEKRNFLNREEMEKMPPKKLLAYHRKLQGLFFKNREVARDPSVLDRWKEARSIAKEILARSKKDNKSRCER